VVHQQAAMPEQLLIPFLDTGPDFESDRLEPGTEPRSAIDLTAPRPLKKSRTDAEVLEFTDEQLRHLQDVFTMAADQARKTMNWYADRKETGAPHPGRGRAACASPPGAGR
jgi:hypothetical protein